MKIMLLWVATTHLVIDNLYRYSYFFRIGYIRKGNLAILILLATYLAKAIIAMCINTVTSYIVISVCE